ncbi:hypothetical protein BGX26_006283 [Mortierella sp. AD094]|nr:hypothetical protein BGX26_006283 [Mortierella sp. AD094]
MNKLLNWLSSTSNLPLKDVLEVANEQLESARNATTPVKALLLCDSAEATLKSAEKIAASKKVRGQNQNIEIANAYLKHGTQLEGLGKAEKWGQTLNLNSTGTRDLKSMSRKHTEQAPQYIFGKDVALPVVKLPLPKPGGRIINTSQLAYCLSLLPPEMISKEGNTKGEYAWSQDASNDLDEQWRLRTLAREVVRVFVRDELKTPEIVAEVVGLAAVLQQDEFRQLLQVFADEIEQSILLEVHLLDGLAHVMRNHPQGNFDADDLIKILSLLGGRLKGTHQQSTQHTYRLATTVSRVLDSMVDSQVEGVDRQQLHEPLSDYLKELQQSSDPCLVFQAAYAYQALQYIPDDESILKSMMRRTGRVIQGISGVVSAVKALDLNRFIEGLQNIQGGLEGAGKAIAVIGEAYQNAKRLADSGHRFLECLQEGFSFTRKSAWYPALRGLDILIREGRLTAFEKLVQGAPCRRNLAFQWGVCQRLGEIAANPVWDTDTRKGAVSFLGEMYTDDSSWGQQVDVKQWILQILNKLAESTEGVVGDHVQMLLAGLDFDGDHEKRAFYQFSMEESQNPYLLTFNLPSSHESWLLDCVQDIPDVEGRLRRLKQERLKERGGDAYVPLRAKLSAGAMEDFDLTSKVQEFLKSNKKVFLVLGDSGAGKSTFSKALEISLWREYKKATGRIPLFIHLPTIERPGQNLIAERLRKANFTESQIWELKKYREFILICDGYDESQQNLYTINQLNQPGEWRAQMVISCRTEYNGGDHGNRFRPTLPTGYNNRSELESFQEAIIAPFNKSQIEDYISQFVSWNKPSWETKDYLQALKKIPNLLDLVTNPFLLRITLDVIPRLLETKSSSTTPITRVELYDEFLRQWIKRGMIRLGDMDLSLEDRKVLGDYQILVSLNNVFHI